MKKKELKPVNKESYFLTKRNILVYPTCDNYKWFIEVNNNGKITRFDKQIYEKEINDALNKTIRFIYEKYYVFL